MNCYSRVFGYGIFFLFPWQVRSKAEAETLMRKIMRHQLRNGEMAGWPFSCLPWMPLAFTQAKCQVVVFFQGSQWRSERAQVGKQRSVRHKFIDGKGHDQWCLANIPAASKGLFYSEFKMYHFYLHLSSDNIMHQIPQCHISYENLVWIAWAVLKQPKIAVHKVVDCVTLQPEGSSTWERTETHKGPGDTRKKEGFQGVFVYIGKNTS